MAAAFRSLLAEPRAPGAPRRVWRDPVLVAVLLAVAVPESVLRTDPVWRPGSLVLVLPLAAALPLRRTRPLVAVALAFAPPALATIVSAATGAGWTGLSASAFALVLPYALVRWGSGREVAIGLAAIVVSAGLSLTLDFPGTGDTLGAFVVLALPAALGTSVRYQAAANRRAIDEVRLLEREDLARELHDTVAHHVSAIAIQAQAGRALAATDRDAALATLAVIEQEAARTLDEMRVMVGTLRRDDDPALAPQPGLTELRSLATGGGPGPRIDVELTGDLDDLPPAIHSGLHRLARESVTNATRHARRATRIVVRVRAEGDRIHLTVTDDGEGGVAGFRTGSGRQGGGYGLVGMAERVKLLGGTIDAGPGPDRGWTVDAVLPRSGRADDRPIGAS